MDHKSWVFYPDLSNSLDPAAARKSSLKHLPRPCSADYPAGKIQNQSPEKTAYRLPTADDYRSFFPGHLQNLNFHQVGNALRL
jgi:hypothetical protein